MFIAFCTFLAMYLIAGALIRLVTLKFPDTYLSNALQFAH